MFILINIFANEHVSITMTKFQHVILTMIFGYFGTLCPLCSDYHLFSELKKVLRGNRFGSSEEVINEAEAYFEGKYNSFYKDSIENLEKRWNEFIATKGDYIDNKENFSQKNCFLLHRPRTF